MMNFIRDIQSYHHAGWGGRIRAVLCLAIILFSLATFAYRGVARSILDEDAIDFYFNIYVAGHLWNEGLNVYDYEVFQEKIDQLLGERQNLTGIGFLYPPQASIVFSAFAHLPMQTAYHVQLAINFIFLLVSTILLGIVISWFRPVGLAEVTLLCAFLNTAYGRASIRQGQLSAVIFAGLLGVFILAQRNRQIGAGVALSMISLKPTFLPLYLGYYALRRSNLLVVTCVAATILLVAVPLVATQRSVQDAITGWLQTVTEQNEVSDINDPSPYKVYGLVMLNLETLVYRILDVQSAPLLVWLIVFGLWALAASLIWRSRPSAQAHLLDFALVSTLTLLSVYHRNYDIFLIFPALIYFYLHMSQLRDEKAKQFWFLILVVCVFTLTLPNDIFTQMYYRDPAVIDHYLWRVIAPYQAWTVVAVMLALLWLKRRQVLQAKQAAVLEPSTA